MYIYAKPEHMTGKTIRRVDISTDYMEITFTDGTSVIVSCRALSGYYPQIEAKYWGDVE